MSRELKCCPYCGSAALEKRSELQEFSVPYGAPARVQVDTMVCRECGLDTDVTEGKDVRDAIDSAVEGTVGRIVDFLGSGGRTLSSVERALDLPERTLSRWKNTPKLSRESITLLRFLRTYTWLVEVADRGYNEAFARGAVLREAGRIVTEATEREGVTVAASACIGETYEALTFTLTKTREKETVHVVGSGEPVLV